MSSTQNTDELMKDFENHTRRLEGALSQIGNQLKKLAVEDLLKNVSSPYLFMIESVALGFYFREKVVKLSESLDSEELASRSS